MRQYQFTNAPKRIKCRVCNKMFDNPILNGSSIVTVVCGSCRQSMLNPKTVRAMAKQVASKKEETVAPTRAEPTVTLAAPTGIKCLNDYR